MWTKEQVETLTNTLIQQIKFPDSRLKQAVARSADLFRHEDIEFSLNALLHSLEKAELKQWWKRNSKSLHLSNSPTSTSALAILAGNLPLVGMQDVLAILMSGYCPKIKLSKKDPHLIPALLDPFIRQAKGSMHTEMDHLQNAQALKWMFTGDSGNLQQVHQQLLELNAIQPQAPLLQRKASFSVAILGEKITEMTLDKLRSAIFTHQGKGCRSVGLIVAKNETALHEFFDLLHSKERPNNRLAYELAYLRALGYASTEWGGFIFSTNLDRRAISGQIGICTLNQWQQLNLPHQEIQNVYKLANVELQPDLLAKEDFLERAQQPDIGWKADGIDSLQWLLNSD